MRRPEFGSDGNVTASGNAHLLWRAANNLVVRTVARRLLPSPVRKMLVTRFINMLFPYRPPTVQMFRALLGETAVTAAVPGRVVMVCGSLQPGGSERQVANTIVGLGSAPIESLTLLCDNLHSGTKEKYEFYLPLARSGRATVRTIKTRWSSGVSATLPTGFSKAAAVLSADLIADVTNLYFEFRALCPEVVHAWLDWSNVRAGLAAVIAGVPKIILSGRNISPKHFVLNTDYFHPAYSALIERSADQITLLNNSQAGADDYEEWLDLAPGTIRVIRNGARFTDDMRPSAEHNLTFRRRLGIPESAPIVGGMFRFELEKQPLLWLETAARVAQALPETHFVLFGQGSLHGRVMKACRALGIAARTHIRDVISPSFNGLSPCDLVLLTSSGEGTPNVLLEAQWLGLPVVTTDAGGAREAILDGVTGSVVKTSDAAAIATAVVRILQDSGFREMARKKGPYFITAKYGMERMIDETLAVYRLSKVASDNSIPAGMTEAQVS